MNTGRLENSSNFDIKCLVAYCFIMEPISTRSNYESYSRKYSGKGPF